MKKQIVTVIMGAWIGCAYGQAVFMDGISISNDYVRYMGLVDMQGWGVDATGAVRHLA